MFLRSLFQRGNRTKATRANPAKKRRAPLALESLEERSLLSITLPTPGTPGPVTITGTNGNDSFVVRLQQAVPSMIQFSDDGGSTFQTAALVDVTSVNVSGLGGNDQLTIDNSNGLVAKASSLPVIYDGGPGNNTVLIQGNPGASGVSETYSVGATSDAGAVNTNDGSVFQFVSFSHLAGITDVTPAGTLVIAANDNSNMIQILNGPTVNGFNTTRVVGIDRLDINDDVDDNLNATTGFDFLDQTNEAFVRMDFARKTNVTVNAAGGDDFVVLNNALGATGMSSLTLDGGTGLNLGAERNTPAGVALNAVNFARADIAAQDLFVDELYELRLHRAPGVSELAFWESVLNGPGGSAAVVQGIEQSFEARDRLVRSWYVRYLGRQAQGGEENGWVNSLRNGATEGSVLAGILGSGEFFNRASSLFNTGDQNGNFVSALYLLLLNRSATSNEIAGWVNQIPAIGRGGVVKAFVTSIEYRNALFTTFYRTILHRAPDSGGLNGWVFSGLDITTVRQNFLNSGEFFRNG